MIVPHFEIKDLYKKEHVKKIFITIIDSLIHSFIF
jgi:hypothetical protein